MATLNALSPPTATAFDLGQHHAIDMPMTPKHRDGLGRLEDIKNNPDCERYLRPSDARLVLLKVQSSQQSSPGGLQNHSSGQWLQSRGGLVDPTPWVIKLVHWLCSEERPRVTQCLAWIPVCQALAVMVGQ